MALRAAKLSLFKFTSEGIVSFVSFSIIRSNSFFKVLHKLDRKYRFRYKTLADQLNKVEGALKLRNLSETRWVARAESVHAVKLRYKQIIESLNAFEKSPLF